MTAIPAFIPHPLLRGGHLQTIGGHFLSRPEKIRHDELHWVEVEGGDRLALEVNFPIATSSPRGTVLLMHGLAGCAESTYIKRLASKLLQEGWITVRLNHRGCGSHGEKARGFYHSGSTHDLWTVIQYLSERWPAYPLATLAFSLSGTMLLNLLGQEAPKCEALASWVLAMAICPPIDLESSSQAVASWNNWHYDRFFSRLLLRHAQTHFPDQYGKIMSEQSTTIRSVREFDALITAPCSGFRDRNEYYRLCSPKFHVSHITKATRVIAAADDPLVPGDTVATAPFSCAVEIDLLPSGGHLGFVSAKRTPRGDYRWLDYVILTECEAVGSGSI